MWMQKIYPHDDDRSQTMDRGDINLKTRFITAGTSRYIYFITEKIANERIIEDGFHVFDLWAGTSSKYFVDGDSLITEFYEMAPGCGSAIVEDDVSFEFYRAQINHKEKRLEKGESIMTIVKSDVNMVEQGKQWKSTRNANGILLVMLTYVGLCVVEIRNNGWISYKDIECDNFGWLWCSPWQEHHMLYCLEYMHYQDTVVVTGHTLSVNLNTFEVDSLPPSDNFPHVFLKGENDPVLVATTEYRQGRLWMTTMNKSQENIEMSIWLRENGRCQHVMNISIVDYYLTLDVTHDGNALLLKERRLENDHFDSNQVSFTILGMGAVPSLLSITKTNALKYHRDIRNDEYLARIFER